MYNAILLSAAALIAVGSLLSVVSTLYLLNESRDHLVSIRLHPMRTLVPGYVLKEFGTSHLDCSC